MEQARNVDTFVITIEGEGGTDRYWIEKVTAHSHQGVEVLSRWCEAVSHRKAHIICNVLNTMRGSE
jgi:hypothetical protein